jgi:hypothetical protein
MTRKIVLIATAAGWLIAAACGRNPASPSSAASITSGASGLNAKGGTPGPPPPPPSDQAATGVFRCPGPDCTGSDRLVGDGLGAYIGKIWGSTGEFRLDLTDPARSLTMDYGDQLDAVVGRRWERFMTITGANGGVLQTNVILPGTDTEAPSGMRSIPVGETWPARMRLGFNITSPTGVDMVWGNRFNLDFPGSTLLRVTRTSATQWIIEATTAEVDYVRSTADKRHGGEVFEGLYHLPFKVTVTVN